MAHRKLTHIPLTLFVLTLILLIAGGSQSRGQVDPDEQLPPGKWTLSANPYFGSGYRTLPVVVVSVTSDSARGLRVTKVGLSNRSSKPITAVSLSWYLTTADDTKTILKQGQTPLITPSGGLPEGAEREIEFPVFSFAKVARTLVRNGELNGNFRVQVAVREVQYEDGSSWTRDE